jgi:lantibiotic modifying enzyme
VSLRNLVFRTASWIDDRLFDIPRLLPGLAFGRAGTAWALYDAARLLDDEEMAARALQLARSLPTRWPSPDITHGLSGAGMAHVHLWRASGEKDLRQRAGIYADNVLAAAQRSGRDWLWPTGTDTDSILAGASVYGFAHGAAGAGAFLLAASRDAADGDGQRWLDAAVEAGNTLKRVAQVEHGIVRWPGSADGTDKPNGHWCGGPTGIATFLIRLGKATGTTEFADLADLATNTVNQDMWAATTGACCGLAGDGQFLLDMAELTGDNRFRQTALHLAELICSQRRAGNGPQFSNISDKDHSYQSGSAGILAFLIRLRYGGPAAWMPTETAVAVNRK